MKQLITLFLLCFAVSAQAAYLTVSVTFTNRTQVGDTLTRDSVTARWTNAPLNSTSWLTTNNPAGSATSLWRHLGANVPKWSVSMSNATNVTIRGEAVQFSITGDYAVLTTNGASTGTNASFLILSGDWTQPQKWQPYATNRTNDASELLNLQKTYALAEARLRFFSNEHYKAARLVDGSWTNGFITNSPSIQTTNLATAKITATSGELNGVNLTNVPWLSSDSNRFGTMIVSGAAVITNLTTPGTGLNSTKIGPGADASGDYSVAVGLNNIASGLSSVAIGGANESSGDFASTFGSGNQAAGDWAFAGGEGSLASGDTSFAYGAAANAAHDLTFVFGSAISSDRASQAKFGVDVTVTGELEAQSTARFANVVRYSQSGPWNFTEGAYSGMTGGSNNVSQVSTTAWTRLSGHVSACNLNSMRTADGLPMSYRRHGIINGGSYDITLIDTLSDGFETLNTNEMDLGGINITLAPKDRAEFIYSTASARWEILYPKPPTNLVVKSTGDFSGADTTNVMAFNAQQIRRMTNAMTTNATFIVSNILAGSSLEIFLIGANGGVIASNYTFTLRTNSLPTATAIHWVTSTNGTYDAAVSSNKFGRIILTAPFTTNIFARYEEGP